MGSLTQEQKSLMIGTILGDGYLRIIPRRKNAFLEINHSVKQKDYVNWKYSVLQSIVKSKPKLRNGNGYRVACRFYTRCHSEITDLFRYFYKDGKKIIPNDLNINSFSLAVWYMDDGSKSGGSIYLNTHQFSIEDQNILHKLLLNKFAISSNLNKDKEYKRIRILTKDAKKFCNLICQFVPKSMEYKLV